MEIKKPIFILNPARSGSTIFYNLFTRHKDTAFPEHYIDKYWKSSIMINFIPMLVKIQQWRYKQRSLPHAGIFWRKYHGSNQVLTEKDVKKDEVKFIHKIIRTQLNAFNAKRFVSRAHDSCLRVGYLNKIFPDAYFVVLRRDPKAVVCSEYTLMKKDWDFNYDKNTYGNVIEHFKTSESKLETCINYYKFYINTMNDGLRSCDRKVEVRYENFVKDPRQELKKLFNFVKLDWYDELEESVPEVLELKNDEKWKKLPEKERSILELAF